MDQQILNKNIQVVDESWDFTLNKNQPKPNQTLSLVAKKNQQKVYHPNKFNALKNRWENFCFSSGKLHILQVFLVVSAEMPTQRNDHPTPRPPRPNLFVDSQEMVWFWPRPRPRLLGRKSLGRPEASLGSVVAFVGWFWWVEKNQPTNQPYLWNICEFGQNWDGIFPNLCEFVKIGMEFNFPQFSRWNIKNRLSCHHQELCWICHKMLLHVGSYIHL